MNRRHQYLFRLILPLLLLPLLAACQRGDPAVDALHRTADSLMQSRPVSALLLLQACDSVGVSPVSAPVDAWPRRQRMRHELLRAKAMNKAYVNFTTDSVMKEVADYYDSHGTPNERMEAHYLLGCTYRDLGEAPRALDCFNDAVSCVEKLQTGDESLEIINADCDYSQLCRIYAQKADILWHQSLLDDYLETLDKAIFYAEKANDSIVMLNSLAYKMCAYEKKNMPDSVISIHRKIHDSYLKIGKPDIAARFAFLSIGSYLMKGLYDEAEKFLDFYERASGYFEENGKIQKGREVYYYMKGKYYASIQANDSAFYWFRKELAEGSDLNNQNGASRELSLLYYKMGIADSAAKYAIYSYEMNDSVYAQMATAEVEKAQNIYNYTRHKEQSIREKERADKEHSRFIVISITSFFAGSFVLLLYRRKVKKQQEERNEYEETKRKYRKLLQEKEELNNLAKSIMAEEKSNKAKLNDIIEEKTREIKQLEDKLNHYNIDTLNIKDTLEDVYKKSDIFEVLEPKIKRGIKLSDEDLAKIESFAQQNMQSLYSFLKSCNLSDNRKRYTCFLFRLHLGVKDVSNLLGVSSSYISQISSDMVNSLFSKTGSSKELKKELLKFDRIDLIPANI